MKLLVEFLQEKLGKEKTEVTFTVKEYMDYANIKDKNEEEVFQQLKEKIERLLKYTITLIDDEDDSITQPFVSYNIVIAILWVDSEFMITFPTTTLTIRQINKNWLVDCVSKGDE